MLELVRELEEEIRNLKRQFAEQGKQLNHTRREREAAVEEVSSAAPSPSFPRVADAGTAASPISLVLSLDTLDSFIGLSSLFVPPLFRFRKHAKRQVTCQDQQLRPQKLI